MEKYNVSRSGCLSKFHNGALATKSDTPTSPNIVPTMKNDSLYSTNLYSTLLFSTLLFSSLLYSTLLYYSLLVSTLLYFALLFSTLLYSSLLFSLIFATPQFGSFSSRLPLMTQCIQISSCDPSSFENASRSRLQQEFHISEQCVSLWDSSHPRVNITLFGKPSQNLSPNAFLCGLYKA